MNRDQIPFDVPPGTMLHFAMERDRAIADMLKARRARKMHIRGPLAGALWVARFLSDPNVQASGITPENAWNNWYSYWGVPS